MWKLYDIKLFELIGKCYRIVKVKLVFSKVIYIFLVFDK